MRAVFAEGVDEGRLQYEAPRLIFRGAARRVYEGDALAGMSAEGGELVLADGTRFALGEKAAGAWVQAIQNPKSRLDKVGAKLGMRAFALDVDDVNLAGELSACGAILAEAPRDLDLLFFGAEDDWALSRIGELVAALAPKGALWIVSRKGKAATVKDVEVMAAARAAGLVGSKVVSFSDTHTALRFTFPHR